MSMKEILTALLFMSTMILAERGYAAGPAVTDSVLVIPAGTRSIGAQAFIDRSDFREIRFEQPCTLADIGEYAFMGCHELRSVSLPASVRKIGTGAFRDCPQLAEVALNDGLKDIASQAFAYDYALTDIDIPASVSHIGANAFSFCTSLRSAILPPNAREIESYIFSDCSAMTSVTFPANSNMLGEMMLYGCRQMREVTVPSATPPTFDCNSQLFDLEEEPVYKHCTLRVPAGAEARYREAPGWRHFTNIQPIK